MNLDAISIGENPPFDINVVIEIPVGQNPVKYEIDKPSGAMVVDRFVHTAMFYPVNYGFVPHTLCDDGDAADVMVVSQVPVVPGSIIRSRPVGVMLMEDEAGGDDKILAVPHDKLHPYYANVSSYRDLPTILIQQIEHFFSHYKDLEVGKWARVVRWGEAGEALSVIEKSIESEARKRS